MKRKPKRVLLTRDGRIIELVPTREWHWQFDWRDLRLGAAFHASMWEINFPGLVVWCDRFEKHGKTLVEKPEGAEVLFMPR